MLSPPLPRHHDSRGVEYYIKRHCFVCFIHPPSSSREKRCYEFCSIQHILVTICAGSVFNGCIIF